MLVAMEDLVLVELVLPLVVILEAEEDHALEVREALSIVIMVIELAF